MELGSLDDWITSSDVYPLEPHQDWKQNFMYWFTKYLYYKCEVLSDRLVAEENKNLKITYSKQIMESDNIEDLRTIINELSKIKFKGVKNYFNSIVPLYDFLIEKKAISIKNITTKTLSRLFLEKFDDLKYATINNRLTAIINFVKYIEKSNVSIIDEGGHLFNIQREEILKYITKESRVLSVLTPSFGYDKFFNTIEQVSYGKEVKERNYLMLKVFMYLGLRVSEAINLKNSDIQIENGFVKFNIIGKGNKQRILSIAHKNIKKNMIEYERKRTPSVDDYYFTTSKGTQLNDRYINTIVEKTILLSGLKVSKSSPHMLRHSVATYLKHNKGLDDLSISKWLGHEDVKTTMVYLHYTEDEIEKIAENFNKVGKK